MSTLQQSLHQRRAADVAVVSCVTTQERQLALILACWQGDRWVLPWSHFVSGRFGADGIELTFANVVVKLTGQNLDTLLDDIAAFRLGCLRDLPTDYRKKLEEGQPFIARIDVRSVTGEIRRAPG